MKQTVFLLSVLFLVVSIFAAMPGVASNVTIPNIKKWKELHGFPFNNGNLGCKRYHNIIVIKWYQDPNRPDYVGQIGYYKDHAFFKTWNFQEDPIFDAKEVLVALLLNDGSWFVGSKGERLHFHCEYNDNGDAVALEFHFNANGQHPAILRKIDLR